MAAQIDTLRYAKKLYEAGFTRKQAEASAEVLSEIIDKNLATKRDIKELELTTKQDIKELGLKFETKLKELENKLTIRMAGMFVITITILGLMMRLIKS